jgi:hypothetical protein
MCGKTSSSGITSLGPLQMHPQKKKKPSSLSSASGGLSILLQLHASILPEKPCQLQTSKKSQVSSYQLTVGASLGSQLETTTKACNMQLDFTQTMQSSPRLRASPPAKKQCLMLFLKFHSKIISIKTTTVFVSAQEETKFLIYPLHNKPNLYMFIVYQHNTLQSDPSVLVK